jgi:alpha-ketoglutarate-dependent taurine dioxygenase
VAMNESGSTAMRQRLRGQRRGIPLSGGDMVRERLLDPAQTLPLVLEPAGVDVDLVSWVAGRRDELAASLLAHGGILFRGFQLAGVEEFERFIRALSDDILDYTYRSTPRSEVGGKIYTSTEYPADQEIPLHNEMSYTRSWPRKIWFFSLEVAASDGETPIADSRKVLQDIPPHVRERFAATGVMYVRNYGSGPDLPWQNVFQTQDRAEVEAFCRRSEIEFVWTGENELRTRQVCHAIARHPETGEDLWFNQAHLFHVSSLAPTLRNLLIDELGEEGLPRNAFYGDGAPIEEEALLAIRQSYRRNEVVFPWQKGDVLMLDNMLIAHGRRPYTGSRRVVVGMAEPWSRTA